MTARFLPFAFCFLPLAFAYDPPVDSAGPLTVRIHEPMLGAYGSGGFMEISQTGVLVPIRISLANSSDATLRGTLRVQVTDRWHVEPSSPVPFSAGPRAGTEVFFTIHPGEGTYNAHYPVHAFAEFDWQGKRLTAHPILILQTNFPNPPRAPLPVEWRPIEAPAHGALAVWRLPVHRESASTASETQPGSAGRETWRMAPVVRFKERVTRGVAREAIAMTLGPRPPSMRERVRWAMSEYPLRLPKGQPIRLKFANAVDDHGATVTFRVCVLAFDAENADFGPMVFQRQSAAAAWEEADVDLSRFAGQDIRLQLVSRTDTSATSQAYWAEPVVIAGDPPQPAPFPPTADAKFRSLGTVGRFEVRLWTARRGLLESHRLHQRLQAASLPRLLRERPRGCPQRLALQPRIR